MNLEEKLAILEKVLTERGNEEQEANIRAAQADLRNGCMSEWYQDGKPITEDEYDVMKANFRPEVYP